MNNLHCILFVERLKPFRLFLSKVVYELSAQNSVAPGPELIVGAAAILFQICGNHDECFLTDLLRKLFFLTTAKCKDLKFRANFADELSADFERVVKRLGLSECVY